MRGSHACAWAALAILAGRIGLSAAEPVAVRVPEPLDLRETVSPSALVDLRTGGAVIAGRVTAADATAVTVRVTTSLGATTQATVAVAAGRFRAVYPDAFAGAPALAPGVLFIDVASGAAPGALAPTSFQAEVTLIVHGGPGAWPELPSAFSNDLLDQAGHTDRASAEWPVVRSLANLYLHSRGARLVHVGRPDFDLARPDDLRWFQNNLTLYEFDSRDRDWAQPLGSRVARTFWQSVWNTWFNPSNDHPLDGNPANLEPANYLPYAFANDFADVLVMYAMRLDWGQPLDDNLLAMVREGAANLAAMQHRSPDNFALADRDGKRERYTAGAFRYGMFENGEFMTEGKGWFYNPAFRDYAAGGVLNGRAVWGLGECLRHDPDGPGAAALRDTIALALRFCLYDGRSGGYAKQTRAGNPYWRDAGEHAYLVIGMLAVCEVAPDLPVVLDPAQPSVPLRALCVQALNALIDLAGPDHGWSIYPNVDAMAVAALAEGAQLLPAQADASRWRATAMAVTDAWMATKVDPKERAIPAPQFGLRPAADRMTYVWGQGRKLQFFLYQDGHWIHALADLYAVTGERRFRDRAEALVSYLCGNNPWQVRLFNELGGVYNWVDDTDGDGIEDLLKQDMYPESTAFCQIGIMRLLRAIGAASGAPAKE
jgi:hypothetical protein